MTYDEDWWRNWVKQAVDKEDQQKRQALFDRALKALEQTRFAALQDKVDKILQAHESAMAANSVYQKLINRNPSGITRVSHTELPELMTQMEGPRVGPILAAALQSPIVLDYQTTLMGLVLNGRLQESASAAASIFLRLGYHLCAALEDDEMLKQMVEGE